MPWKDPNNWIAAETMAPILSFLLSLCRVIWQSPESSWTKRFTESGICGMLTVSVGYVVNIMGYHSDLKYAAAGAIGFLGADYIRNIATKAIDKKVDDK